MCSSERCFPFCLCFSGKRICKHIIVGLRYFVMLLSVAMHVARIFSYDRRGITAEEKNAFEAAHSKSLLLFVTFLFWFLFLFLSFLGFVFDLPLLGFRFREFRFRTGGGAGRRCYRGTPLFNNLVSIFVFRSSVLMDMVYTKSSATQL